MQKTSFTLFCFLTIIVLSGCSHIFYAPNLMSTPHLSAKNDASVGGSLVSGFGHTGYEINTSWSPRQHLAFMINGYQYKRSLSTDPNNPEWDKIRMVEGAVGLYTPAKNGVWSLFAGYGMGDVRSQFTSYITSYPYSGTSTYDIAQSHLQMRRIFIQPAYTLKNELLEVGLGMRMVGLFFPSGDVDLRLNNSYEGQQNLKTIRNIQNSNPFWLPEFGGRIAVRFQPCTFGISGVFVLRNHNQFGFDNSSMGATLTLNLQECMKSNKK
jgi:hypothetical protein